MARTSCGLCDPCLERRPERCVRIVGKARFRELLPAPAARPDPSSISRSAGGRASFALELSDSEVFRSWVERVRSLVKNAIRLPWWVARAKFTAAQMRAWYDAGASPQEVAEQFVSAWMRDLEFEAPLC